MNAMPTKSQLQSPILDQRTTQHKAEGKASFSRATDYLYAIAPVYLGAGYFLLKDYFSAKNTVPQIQYTGTIQSMFGMSPSSLAHIASFALIMFGVGAGFYLVHVVNTLEEWDKGNR